MISIEIEGQVSFFTKIFSRQMFSVHFRGNFVPTDKEWALAADGEKVCGKPQGCTAVFAEVCIHKYNNAQTPVKLSVSGICAFIDFDRYNMARARTIR